ncbi:hypothetical protein N9L24_00730 [Candidatus Marinamargulisbacteria bacterium]|nr:hypothetical protein [Candidatus Marinamargulisbacteria bacterium]
MILINHRINTIKQLNEVPINNGIELDIRYHENTLILHHDPFQHHENNPEKFEELLKKWHHKGPMVLNIKTEGVENFCIDLVNKYNVKNWFFLDLSMPYFSLYSQKAHHNEINGFSANNLAVRFSEYEPIEYALAFCGKAKWVWVDCFTYLPIDIENYKKLKKAGFKLCIVSPELQNHSKKYIEVFKKQLDGFNIDAVCTKYPDLWQ